MHSLNLNTIAIFEAKYGLVRKYFLFQIIIISQTNMSITYELLCNISESQFRTQVKYFELMNIGTCVEDCEPFLGIMIYGIPWQSLLAKCFIRLLMQTEIAQQCEDVSCYWIVVINDRMCDAFVLHILSIRTCAIPRNLMWMTKRRHHQQYWASNLINTNGAR